MKFTTNKKCLLIAASIAALSASPAIAANLAGNGGFEVPGVGGPLDSDLWTEFAGGPGSFSVRGGPPAAGLFAHELVAIGSTAGGGGVAGITQNSIGDVGFLSLAPGSSLSASFDYQSILGPGGVGFAELKILNSVGGIVAGTGLLALPATPGIYVPISTPSLIVPAFGPVPSDTYAAFLEISYGAGAFDGSMATGLIDNVVITGTVIPEPTSLGLLALGSGLVFFRRRRSTNG